MVDLDEVARMKNLGMSYREIASRLGVPQSTLEARIKAHGFKKLFCKDCGKEIIGRPRKFCNKQCRDRYFNFVTHAGRVHISRPHSFFCKICGVKVEAEGGDRRRLYCSKRCKDWAYRLKHAKNKGLVWKRIEKELKND